MDSNEIQFTVEGQKKPVKWRLMLHTDQHRSLLVYRMLNSARQLGERALADLFQQALAVAGFSLDLYRIRGVELEPDDCGLGEAIVFTVKVDEDDVLHRVKVQRSFPTGWHMLIDDGLTLPGSPLWAFSEALTQTLISMVTVEVNAPPVEPGFQPAVAVLPTDDDGVPIAPPVSLPPAGGVLSDAEREAAEADSWKARAAE